MGERTQAILIVDDEPANVQLLERLLTSSGYSRVRSTTDPKRVVTLYRDLQPDLILLDLHMPGLDGFTVMQQLSEMIASDDYVPILVLTADVTATSKQRALVGGAKDFLTKPLDTAEVLARVGNLLETRSLHVQLRRHNELLEEKVRERTAALWDTVGQLERAQKDLRLAQEETIHSLSLAAEFRDDETSRHIERMSRYCAVLADAMGLDTARQDTIRVAAKMHDVGKIGVGDSILLKPGKLTTDEFETMKAHAQIGYEILSGSTSELATTAAVIAWTHHEKVDGSGYPRGLVGRDIPQEGRIAAVADVFDALTTDRVYRKAFTLPEALEIMLDGRDAHFDADILDLFFDRIDVILRTKQALDESAA
jgi:putative two-component system response regulator